MAVGRDITYDRGANGVFPVRTGQGQCKPGIALMSILGEGGGSRVSRVGLADGCCGRAAKTTNSGQRGCGPSRGATGVRKARRWAWCGWRAM